MMNYDTKYDLRKIYLGALFGFLLAFILLLVDNKLWIPLELETINNRNTFKFEKAILKSQNKTFSNDIVVVLFDDKTQFLLRLKGLPIKDFEKRGRDIIHSFIERLESSGVTAIGINLNLGIPSESSSDEKLAKTISKYKNIVIADSIYSPIVPTNKILKVAGSVGFGELFADYDNIVHKIELTSKSNTRESPSLSYALFKLISKKKLAEMNNHEFYLRYPENKIEAYSFIDLIQNKISLGRLKNKIVILGIGLNSKLMKDSLVTPYNKKQFISDTEVQAIALENLLNHSYLKKSSLTSYPFLFLLVGSLFGIIFSFLSAFKRLLFAGLFLLVLICGSQLAYNNFNLIIELVPLIFLYAGNLAIGSIIFLQLDLHEKNVELEKSHVELESRNEELNKTLNELHIRVKELKNVRKQLSHRSEDERKRIARELHDDTLARLTDLKRHIEQFIAIDGSPAVMKKELNFSIETLTSITSEIRRIINALRPSMLDNVLGLIPSIENLLDEFSKRSNHKIKTKFISSIARLTLSEADEINLYRIIQEALNNIFKHSKATHLEIIIQEQPGQILILVNDNGVGMHGEKQEKSYGFLDMKERAELIGASIQCLNKPHRTGFSVEISIPKDKIKNLERILVNNLR